MLILCVFSECAWRIRMILKRQAHVIWCNVDLLSTDSDHSYSYSRSFGKHNLTYSHTYIRKKIDNDRRKEIRRRCVLSCKTLIFLFFSCVSVTTVTDERHKRVSHGRIHEILTHQIVCVCKTTI